MAERLRLCSEAEAVRKFGTSRVDGCQAAWFPRHDGQTRL